LPLQSKQIHRTTKFTCCARCGAVAPRVLGPTRHKIADKAQRDACFVLCREALRAHFGLQ
jgi:hypothetical protein